MSLGLLSATTMAGVADAELKRRVEPALRARLLGAAAPP